MLHVVNHTANLLGDEIFGKPTLWNGSRGVRQVKRGQPVREVGKKQTALIPSA